MDPREAIDGVRDAISGRRVFGKPVERDGVTVIPAAVVIGGGGGGGSEGSEGGGDGPGGPPAGAGMGFGLIARPAGAWEIRDGQVRWHPAVDRTLLWVGAQAVLVGALLVLRSVLRDRR